MKKLTQERIDQIKQLRAEYERYNDPECAAMCARALAGDQASIDEALEVLHDQTYGGSGEEPAPDYEE
jgi:hypothetical protein